MLTQQTIADILTLQHATSITSPACPCRLQPPAPLNRAVPAAGSLGNKSNEDLHRYPPVGQPGLTFFLAGSSLRLGGCCNRAHEISAVLVFLNVCPCCLSFLALSCLAKGDPLESADPLCQALHKRFLLGKRHFLPLRCCLHCHGQVAAASSGWQENSGVLSPVGTHHAGWPSPASSHVASAPGSHRPLPPHRTTCCSTPAGSRASTPRQTPTSKATLRRGLKITPPRLGQHYNPEDRQSRSTTHLICFAKNTIKLKRTANPQNLWREGRAQQRFYAGYFQQEARGGGL